MDSPIILSTEGIVSDPDGAICYQWDDTKKSYAAADTVIPYGTIISVLEERYDLTMTEIDSPAAFALIRYNDRLYYISLSNITAAASGLLPEDEFRFDEPITMKVVHPEGVIMYTGPSGSYSEVCTIASGETFILSHGDSYTDIFSCAYCYGEYHGYCGWVRTYYSDGEVPLLQKLASSDVNTGDLTVFADNVNMYAEPSLKDATAAVLCTIPKGTSLHYEYFFEAYDKRLALVEYNGTEGYVRTAYYTNGTRQNSLDYGTGMQISLRNLYFYAEEDMPLYEPAAVESTATDESDVRETIPAGTLIKIDAMYVLKSKILRNFIQWYQFSMNGKVYYLHTIHDYNGYEELFKDEMTKAEFDAPVAIHEHADGDSAVLEMLTPDSGEKLYSLGPCVPVFDEDGDYYYLVASDHGIGWTADFYSRDYTEIFSAVDHITAVLNRKFIGPTTTGEDATKTNKHNTASAQEDSIFTTDDAYHIQRLNEMRTYFTTVTAAFLISSAAAIAIILLIGKKKKR